MANLLTREAVLVAMNRFRDDNGIEPNVLRVSRTAWNVIRQWGSEGGPDWESVLRRDLEGAPVTLLNCRVLAVLTGGRIAHDFTYDFEYRPGAMPEPPELPAVPVTRDALENARDAFVRTRGYEPDTLLVTRHAWVEICRWARDELGGSRDILLTAETPTYFMGCRVRYVPSADTEISVSFAYEFVRCSDAPRPIVPPAPRVLPLSGSAVSARQLAVAALLREQLADMTDEEFTCAKQQLPAMLATLRRPLPPPTRERVVEL